MDTTRVGTVAAELMEGLAEGWEDHPHDVEIGEVLILVELRGDDGDAGWTDVAFRCSDPRQWVQRGLLHAALSSDDVEPLAPDEDDDR